MSNHLSQDQMSRWILGQSSPEEEAHGRSCPRCSAELIQFRETVLTFQGAMKTWSEGEVVPTLKEIPNAMSWRYWLYRPSLRLALVGMTIAVLIAYPIYRQPEPESGGESVTGPKVEAEANEANEDVLLMQEVTAHLSRPLPMAMERVRALLPSEDAWMIEQPIQMPEGKEIR